VVVVNFWGSWCTPCRAEAPDLARLSTQTASEGVRFVGVDIRDEQAAGLAFEHEFGITYPSLYDPDDAAAAGFNPWPPVGTPTTYVIDTRGRIAAVFSGLTRYTDLQPVVEQIVEHG
jgi:thiol-disulfide isomerase/thioredoxin